MLSSSNYFVENVFIFTQLYLKDEYNVLYSTTFLKSRRSKKDKLCVFNTELLIFVELMCNPLFCVRAEEASGTSFNKTTKMATHQLV